MGSIRELLMRTSCAGGLKNWQEVHFFPWEGLPVRGSIQVLPRVGTENRAPCRVLENSYKPNSTRRKLTWEPPLTKNRAPLNKKAS